MQVRLLVHGVNTVLGDGAADAELFVTEDFEEVRQQLYVPLYTAVYCQIYCCVLPCTARTGCRAL
jgi:hypothetical protein